jgi:hypothetical protein
MKEVSHFEIPDVALSFIEKCIENRLDTISLLTGRPYSHNFTSETPGSLDDDILPMRMAGSGFNSDGEWESFYWGVSE